MQKRNNQFSSKVKEFIADGQSVRLIIQLGFLMVVMFIGYEFYLFVEAHQNTEQVVYLPRPPGVEGFLPISSLISLKYWIVTGIFNTIHPSGLVIFLIILVIGLLFKKGFCSWICPVGLISESLWIFGKKVFKKNISVPRWLDYPLRSIKYLLLLFFLYAIVLNMDIAAMEKFIYSPYNKVADVKMLLFFTHISHFALWTILVLVLVSVIIKNFWCRYLCPYGALLGFISMFSPVKVTRNNTTCIDCEECTQVCPHSIVVHNKNRIVSDECTACALCIDVCPVENTLSLKPANKSRPIPVWLFGLTIVLIFSIGTLLARWGGYWENDITEAEYRRRIQEIHEPVYEHNRGEVPDYSLED